MSMNLPTISTEYTWQVENHLHTEKLARNEVRIMLVEAHPTRILHRRKVLLSKTIRLKDPNKREDKIEHAARKLLKKFQTQAYQENTAAYANYLTVENMRHDRFNPLS